MGIQQPLPSLQGKAEDTGEEDSTFKSVMETRLPKSAAQMMENLDSWEEAQRDVKREVQTQREAEDLLDGYCSDREEFHVNEEKVATWLVKVCLAGSTNCDFSIKVVDAVVEENLVDG